MTDQDAETVPIGRIGGLDVLRGLALGGILVVNAAWFALPTPLADSPTVAPSAAPLEWGTWAFVSAFFELKFVAIFSLLFGAGVVLRAGGRDPTDAEVRVQRRRLAILACIGLAHGLFLFVGDILLPYAGAGLILLWTRRFTPRTQITLGLALILGAALTHAVWRADAAPVSVEEFSAPVDASSPTIGAALDILSGGDPAQLAALEWTAYRRGPVSLALFVRSVEYIGALIELYLPYFFWRVLGFFLLGAGLVRAGALAPSGARRLQTVQWTGLGVGLPLSIAATAGRFATHSQAGALAGLAAFAHELSAFLLALGLSATILRWSASGTGPLRERLAAAGRMALTNYIGQSVVMVILMSAFGLFGTLSRPAQLALALAIFALQLEASSRWLQRHKQGPLERAWRGLASRARG